MKTSFITTIDDHGKIVTKANLKNVEEDILAYFVNLGGETKVVIESMSSGTGFMILLLERVLRL